MMIFIPLICLMLLFGACSTTTDSIPVISLEPDITEEVLAEEALAEEVLAEEVLAEEALAEEALAEALYEEDEIEEPQTSPDLLYEIMDARRDTIEYFDKVLADPEFYEVQILLTEITRDQSGQPLFTSYEFGVDVNQYFYPACTVKMAMAALTLEKLNSIEGADLNCVFYGGGRTMKDYIYRLINNSSNIAYNNLYDFLGQEYMNETLHSKGYTDCQIIRRFDSPTSVAGDRVNYSWVLRAANGTVVYRQDTITNKDHIYSLRDREDMKGLLRGDSHINGAGYWVNAPKEFYDYNFISIETLQRILKAIMFPMSVPESARFNMTDEDREFLLSCMSGGTTFRRHIFYGSEGELNPNVAIYNKTGTGYGNLLDNSYIVDEGNNIEFMITAVIYVNPNRVINDDTYHYDDLAMPFLRELGQAVYNGCI